MLAFGIAGHALLSRAVKTVLWAWSPLATGEPEAATYERRVYHTADRRMTQLMAAAAGAGAVFWLAFATGWLLLCALAFVALGAVVLLDVLRWERVAVSAHNLWFQRGYRSTVHQVALENIRDLGVDESEARGFTLRHGRRSRVVRLTVRMKDKRLVALPKTDARGGSESVEAVANAGRRAAQPRASSSPSLAEQEDELRRALAHLRHKAASRRELKSASGR